MIKPLITLSAEDCLLRIAGEMFSFSFSVSYLLNLKLITTDMSPSRMCVFRVYLFRRRFLVSLQVLNGGSVICVFRWSPVMILLQVKWAL